MKVIEKGSLSWTKQVKCKGCNAVLGIEGHNDIDYRMSDAEALNQQYDLEPEGIYFIICPECKLEIVIKSKDIPPSIRDIVRYS